MSEEQMPGAHAQRCFAAAWRAAEQMGWIVGDEVWHPFAVSLMGIPRTGYANRVVIAPEAELSNALRRPGRWVCLHQDPPEAPGVRLEVYDAQLHQRMGAASEWRGQSRARGGRVERQSPQRSAPSKLPARRGAARHGLA
jgi:hypothetical protein